MFPQRNRLLASVEGSFSGVQCVPFASLRRSILQVLMLGANKGRWLPTKAAFSLWKLGL